MTLACTPKKFPQQITVDVGHETFGTNAQQWSRKFFLQYFTTTRSNYPQFQLLRCLEYVQEEETIPSATQYVSLGFSTLATSPLVTINEYNSKTYQSAQKFRNNIGVVAVEKTRFTPEQPKTLSKRTSISLVILFVNANRFTAPWSQQSP